ncbi:hypothetical protein [Halalkalibacter lacteus]|uniref:hypothetical protein n=1 Tax=Halalkalibacter lacteus TaxID=3090663 RepID=UPI002FC9B115
MLIIVKRCNKLPLPLMGCECSYWNNGFYNELVGVVDKVDILANRIKLRFGDDFEYNAIDCLKSVERLDS